MQVSLVRVQHGFLVLYDTASIVYQGMSMLLFRVLSHHRMLARGFAWLNLVIILMQPSAVHQDFK